MGNFQQVSRQLSNKAGDHAIPLPTILGIVLLIQAITVRPRHNKGSYKNQKRE